MTLAKNMISFNGYLVTDYRGATTIYIEKSKDKKDIHGNPVRTGLLNLSDAIRTKKNEDIDYKSIYYYCKSIFDKNFDKNNNSDIVKFDETAKINNAKKSNIIIQKCTVPNMEAVFDIDILKKNDPQMAKDLNIIFKYAKHVLQYKYGFDQMSELVLSGSFHNTDVLNVLLFTFRKDNPGTSVPSCTISITSVFVDGYKEKDTDNTFEIDEHGIELPTKAFFENAYKNKAYDTNNNIINIKNAFSYYGFVSSDFYDTACKNDPNGEIDGFSEEDYADPNIVGQKMFNYVIDGILRYLYDLSNKNNQLLDNCFTRMELDTKNNNVISSLMFMDPNEVKDLDNMYDWDDIELIVKDIENIDKVIITTELIYAIYQYMIYILERFTEFNKIWNDIVGEQSSIGTIIEYAGFTIGITASVNSDKNPTLCLISTRSAYEHMNRHRDDAVNGAIIHDNKPQVLNSIGLFGFDPANIELMAYDVTNDIVTYTMNRLNIINNNSLISEALSIIPFYIKSLIGLDSCAKFSKTEAVNLPSIDKSNIDVDEIKKSIKSFNRVDKLYIDTVLDDVVYELFDNAREVTSYLINHIREVFKNATWVNHDMMHNIQYLFGMHFTVMDGDNNIVKDTIHHVTIINSVSSDSILVYYDGKIVK